MTELPDGRRVRFTHIRWGVTAEFGIATGTVSTLRMMDPKADVLPYGGMTVARIDPPQDGVGRGVRGVARCSTADNYNKRAGRDLALDRALRQIGQALVGPPDNRRIEPVRVER